MLKNAFSYSASTESIKVVAQNIEGIEIGFKMLGTGTTASTLATTIAHSSAVKLTVGGEIETLITHADLFVLDYILYDILNKGFKPAYLMTTTTDNTYGFLTTFLPVELTTDKEVYLNIDYTGVANADTFWLDIKVVYGDKPFPAKPIALRYITFNAATNFSEYDMSVAGKRLIGLLVFGTTIPATTTDTYSVSELKILVKREEKAHMTWLSMMPIPIETEDTVAWAIADNYRFFDCHDDPIPADDLKISTKSITATDAVRVIGLYI